MRKNLNKYNLNFENALTYTQSILVNANTLSNQLIQMLDFKNGQFFTLLPDDADLGKINEFRFGGILQQNPEEEYSCNGIKSTYSIIPKIDNDLCLLIFKEIQHRNNISCIFDDVNSDFNGVNTYDLFINNGLYLKNEIYYYINTSSISTELIKKCLKNSSAFWHSLCVFSLTNLHRIKKELKLEDLKKICKNTELFMIGAYDSEGYVFWEKDESKFFE